tara:strand:- start:453 stop:680 length:228 start_codon:yes stop_codon:yes gene_type:complete
VDRKNKVKKLIEAFREGTQVSEIQMGFVFGVGYMMMMSLIFHSLLPTRWHYMLAGVILIIAAYLERVLLSWHSKV